MVLTTWPGSGGVSMIGVGWRRHERVLFGRGGGGGGAREALPLLLLLFYVVGRLQQCFQTHPARGMLFRAGGGGRPMMLVLLMLSLLRRLSVLADGRMIAPRHRRAGLATVASGFGRQRWITSTRSSARPSNSTPPLRPSLRVELSASTACNKRARKSIR